MKAFRLMDWGLADLADVPDPEPAPDEVLIRVAGTGLCRSDLHFMDAPPDGLRYPPPFTLGHEIAGWIEDVGASAHGASSVGDAVALYTIDFCGRCAYCLDGAQNYCVAATAGRGFGTDGGLARFAVARPDQLVPLRDLDPHTAPPLTDAGMTSYHAVARVLPKLRPGAVAVVIGVGGLGSFAVQLLRELSAAAVVALDTRADRVPYAVGLGAAEAFDDAGDLVEAVRDISHGRGADAVLDFVGATDSMRTALRCASVRGSVVVIGVGGGAIGVERRHLPFECELLFTRAGTPTDLAAVVRLAEQGRISADAQLYGLDQVADAYADLRSGRLVGRAVVIPEERADSERRLTAPDTGPILRG